MINTWFKFEGKIPNDIKVTEFKRNHTDDDDNDDDDDGGEDINRAITLLSATSHNDFIQTATKPKYDKQTARKP